MYAIEVRGWKAQILCDYARAAPPTNSKGEKKTVETVDGLLWDTWHVKKRVLRERGHVSSDKVLDDEGSSPNIVENSSFFSCSSLCVPRCFIRYQL